jgi:hypothetical protein
VVYANDVQGTEDDAVEGTLELWILRIADLVGTEGTSVNVEISVREEESMVLVDLWVVKGLAKSTEYTNV